MNNNEVIEDFLQEMKLQRALLIANRSKLEKSNHVSKIKIVITGNGAHLQQELVIWCVRNNLEENIDMTPYDDYQKLVKYKERYHHLEMSAVAGLEDYRTLLANYLSEADIMIMVLDIGIESDFDLEIAKMMSNIKKIMLSELNIIYACNIEPYARNRPIMSLSQIKNALLPFGIPLMPFNRSTGEGVAEIFDKALEVMYWPSCVAERKKFIHLLITLLISSSKHSKSSFWLSMPSDLKLYIIKKSINSLSTLAKTEKQVIGCIRFAFENKDLIRKLVKSRQRIVIKETVKNPLVEFGIFKLESPKNFSNKNNNNSDNFQNERCNIM